MTVARALAYRADLEYRGKVPRCISLRFSFAYSGTDFCSSSSFLFLNRPVDAVARGAIDLPRAFTGISPVPRQDN